MNKYINNNIDKIFRVFLYMQPFIDLVTSLCLNVLNINITLGFIIRAIFLFLVFIYCLVNKKIDGKSYIYLGLIIIYGIFFTGNVIYSKGIEVLFYEVSNAVKFLYLPMLLLLLRKVDIKINLEDIIKVAFIYILLIFIPSIFNIGFNSYTQGKVGSVGWFNSGNEISAILSILCPFIVYYLFKEKNLIKKVILIIISLYTFLIMGSKIIVVSLFISFIVNLVIYFINNKNNRVKVIIFSSVVVIMGLVVLPFTNFYRNIVLHVNFLNINSISDVFSYNGINRLIFSDRLSYFDEVKSYYDSTSFENKMVGTGFIINYSTDSVSTKMIEMDFLDIFYRLGIIGFVLYLVPFIYLFMDYRKKVYLKNDDYILCNTSDVLMLILAGAVGHFLGAPGVSIYLLVIMFYRRSLIV